MDDQNLTPEVLYGPGATPTTPPIPIEETPEIPMETPAEPQQQIPPPPPMPSVSRGSPIVTIIIFIILILAGILLFNYFRPFFPGGGTIVPKSTSLAPTPTPVDPFAGWKTVTIAGLSYKLPPAVLVPTCDGTACISLGTYLPGGTRFTVATRGPSAFVTDANGIAFVNKEASVSGHTATEFIGTFTGKTMSGYMFTQMHGFMISMGPTATIEINHFTPAGATADFAKDDTLFTQIISTLSFSSAVSAPPITTGTPAPATSSGRSASTRRLRSFIVRKSNFRFSVTS